MKAELKPAYQDLIAWPSVAADLLMNIFWNQVSLLVSEKKTFGNCREGTVYYWRMLKCQRLCKVLANSTSFNGKYKSRKCATYESSYLFLCLLFQKYDISVVKHLKLPSESRLKKSKIRSHIYETNISDSSADGFCPLAPKKILLGSVQGTSDLRFFLMLCKEYVLILNHFNGHSPIWKISVFPGTGSDVSCVVYFRKKEVSTTFVADVGLVFLDSFKEVADDWPLYYWKILVWNVYLTSVAAAKKEPDLMSLPISLVQK